MAVYINCEIYDQYKRVGKVSNIDYDGTFTVTWTYGRITYHHVMSVPRHADTMPAKVTPKPVTPGASSSSSPTMCFDGIVSTKVLEIAEEERSCIPNTLSFFADVALSASRTYAPKCKQEYATRSYA